MNKADSERIAWGLEKMGFSETDDPREADIVILNGCVVRKKAEDRVISRAFSLKSLKERKPSALFVLTGCVVSDGIEERLPFFDVFAKPGDYGRIFEEAGRRFEVSEGEPHKPGVSVFVPIIYGCDNFCSYCIVPYRRGRERSRSPEDVEEEVRGLVERGAREVVLLGQNVDSYGKDIGTDLSSLLERLNKIDGLLRIRFLTNHPKDMTDRLIDTVARLDKVCEFISLPVQSGDDEILKKMRRGYTVSEFKELVRKIRERIPDVGITTDVIVGFPGESEEAFERTLSLLEEVKFDKVHVAAYSERPGTLSSRLYKDDIPQEEKMRRLYMVEELEEKISLEKNTSFVGKEVEVLIEGVRGDKFYGRTRNGRIILVDKGKVGELVKVRVERASPWSLYGEKVEEGRCLRR